MANYRPPYELSDYESRPDLCAAHQSALYYLKDFGSIIRVKGEGWFCTNDSRISRVGEAPNEALAQPTLGPFKSAKIAVAERNKATLAGVKP